MSRHLRGLRTPGVAGWLLGLVAVVASGGAVAQTQGQLPLLVGTGPSGMNFSVPIQTLLFFTALSFLPAVLLMMTGFTRIVIVLSLLRQALGTQSSPPNQVIVGLSLFLTFFVMGPTLDKVYKDAYLPYSTNAIPFEQALDKAEVPMRQFMSRQTRQSDLALFVRLAKLPPGSTADKVPMRVLVPAFVTSELKSAFHDLHSLSRHRHRGGERADVIGHDDVVASSGRTAFQADAVCAGRRLEFADRLAGCQFRRELGARAMNAQMVLTMGQEALLTLLMVSAPVLGVVLVVGLVVSLVQAITQINEATLTFIPKLVAAVIVFALAGPWMLSVLIDYIRRTIEAIPASLI